MTTSSTSNTRDPQNSVANLRALANPVRLRIVALLRGQEWALAHLSSELGLSRGTVLYHMRLLEQAGLVKRTSTKRVRGGLQHEWSLTATAFVGDGDTTSSSDRPSVVQSMAAQMAVSEGQRLLISYVRLLPDQREKAVSLLQDALSEIRALESPSGELVAFAALSYTDAENVAETP
jgi:DNA-binding transcriptional ArsR family regulator